jgi:molybdate transport system substrate-binding protein
MAAREILMRTTLSLLLIFVFTSPAFGEELRLYAAAGVKSPLLQMVAEYEAATGHTVTCVFDTAGGTERRFRADPRATFLVTTQTLISEAEKASNLTNGITYPLGDTVAGFAAPPGSPKPDISTPEKLKMALLSAHRIAFSDPAKGATVGTHFMKVIESLGIKDAVLKKATLAQDGIETMRLVVEGKVDLGITQISEIIQADQHALVGPFPKEFDLATTYSLWYGTSISSAAKDFVNLMTSPASRVKLAEDGLRAPTQR